MNCVISHKTNCVISHKTNCLISHKMILKCITFYWFLHTWGIDWRRFRLRAFRSKAFFVWFHTYFLCEVTQKCVKSHKPLRFRMCEITHFLRHFLRPKLKWQEMCEPDMRPDRCSLSVMRILAGNGRGWPELLHAASWARSIASSFSISSFRRTFICSMRCCMLKGMLFLRRR